MGGRHPTGSDAELISVGGPDQRGEAPGSTVGVAPQHAHWAERVACSYLEARGMRLLAHNYRLRGAELDLVMCHDQQLVAVEVKQRKSAAYGHPAEHVGARQLARVRLALQHYASFVLRRPSAALRVDVVLVLGTEQRHQITHLRAVA